MHSVSASRRPWRRLAAALVGCRLLSGAPLIAAEPSQPATAEQMSAQALFEAGRELMQEGRLIEACPKLEQSARLEDAPGTRLNLALCYEGIGRTASAWVNYKDALALAVKRQDAQRQQIARERLAALEASLSRVVVVLDAPRPEGVWLTVDNVDLHSEGFDLSLPLDPGVHRLRAGAPGYETEESTFNVVASERLQRVRLPALTRGRPTRPTRDRSSLDDKSRIRLILAGSTLGLGVAGLASGALFGWEAKQAWKQRDAACRGGCDAAAVAADERTRRLAWAADISFGIGLVGLACGGYLLWTTPRGHTVTVAIHTTANGNLLMAGGSL